MCVFVYMPVLRMCKYLQRPEEVARYPGAGITGGYEPPDAGAGN